MAWPPQPHRNGLCHPAANSRADHWLHFDRDHVLQAEVQTMGDNVNGLLNAWASLLCKLVVHAAQHCVSTSVFYAALC